MRGAIRARRRRDAVSLDKQVSQAIDQSLDALGLGLCGRWDDAFNAVQAMVDAIGPRAVAIASATWSDRYIEHAIDAPHSHPISIGEIHHIEASTGALDADVPYGVAWSARVIAARAAFDVIAFAAVLGEPDDGADLGDCIGWLLQTVAWTINGLPRGFAYMGKDIHV